MLAFVFTARQSKQFLKLINEQDHSSIRPALMHCGPKMESARIRNSIQIFPDINDASPKFIRNDEA
jgi:hypothetical protein